MTPFSHRYLFQYLRWRYFIMVSFVGLSTLHPPISVIVTVFHSVYSTEIQDSLIQEDMMILSLPLKLQKHVIFSTKRKNSVIRV